MDGDTQKDGRTFTILHAFAKDDVYFVPMNAHELSVYTDDELKDLVDAKHLIISHAE